MCFTVWMYYNYIIYYSQIKAINLSIIERLSSFLLWSKNALLPWKQTVFLSPSPQRYSTVNEEEKSMQKNHCLPLSP